MPAQIFIIPPKQSRAYRPLTATQSDKSIREVNLPQSKADSATNGPGKSSSDNKLKAMKSIPSVRISPPQPITDSLFDWDEEDRRFGNAPKLIRHRQLQLKKLHERLAQIQDNVGHQHVTLPAIVSAPMAEVFNAQSITNVNEHTTMAPTITIRRDGSLDSNEVQGQTLLHLAAKLGHEEIIRMLISETSHVNSLLNTRGQTPLLCAIEAGSTSTATLLMEQDPLSLMCKDNIGSSAFHYAAEQCNDIVLSRALALLKRLSSSAARVTVRD